MVARMRRGMAGLCVAIMLAACGGSSGDGDDGASFLPLLAADELVSPMGTDTATNVLVVCQDGPRIYVAWEERSNAIPDAILFTRSLDGGLTWLPAVVVSNPANNSGQVAMCCDGDVVILAYRSSAAGSTEVRLNRSVDAGTTFLANDVVVSDLADGASSTQVCCDGNIVHVVWEDSRNGPREDIFHNRSIDGGLTFPDPDLRLDTDTAGAAGSQAPVLCCDGERVVVAWIDTRSGTEAIRLNRSLDGGSTFLLADLSVSHSGVTPSSMFSPAVVCAGSLVTVVWSDDRNGEFDVFANRSLDGGATFLALDRRVDTDAPGAAASTAVATCLEDGVLHVVWQDTRTGTRTPRYSRSTDGGLSFLTQDRLFGNTPAGSADVEAPDVLCRGDAVIATWSEDRPPLDQRDVFVSVSTDGGDSFTEQRINTNPEGSVISFNPRPVLVDDTLVIVYQNATEVRTNRTAP